MSDFTAILRDAVEQVPGALGAIFVAWDGEPVSRYTPDMPTLDLEILGAQWGLVWIEIGRALGRARLGAALELLVDVEHSSVLVHQVTDQYYVVLLARPSGHLASARRALEAAVLSLRREMG